MEAYMQSQKQKLRMNILTKFEERPLLMMQIVNVSPDEIPISTITMEVPGPDVLLA